MLSSLGVFVAFSSTQDPCTGSHQRDYHGTKRLESEARVSSHRPAKADCILEQDGKRGQSSLGMERVEKILIRVMSS